LLSAATQSKQNSVDIAGNEMNVQWENGRRLQGRKQDDVIRKSSQLRGVAVLCKVNL